MARQSARGGMVTGQIDTCITYRKPYPRVGVRSVVLESFSGSTLYNVCSVHWGMFSTLGGVQYIGGIS